MPVFEGRTCKLTWISASMLQYTVTVTYDAYYDDNDVYILEIMKIVIDDEGIPPDQRDVTLLVEEDCVLEWEIMLEESIRAGHEL